MALPPAVDEERVLLQQGQARHAHSGLEVQGRRLVHELQLGGHALPGEGEGHLPVVAWQAVGAAHEGPQPRDGNLLPGV